MKELFLSLLEFAAVCAIAVLVAIAVIAPPRFADPAPSDEKMDQGCACKQCECCDSDFKIK